MSLIMGTSGWHYNEWVGPFYSIKKRMLSQYVRIFNTAEINSTFYRYPSPRMVHGWYKTAPPGFVYALKLPKLITHDKWLSFSEGVEDDTRKFLDLVQPLAEKLGPILIQLRPKFRYEEHISNLENFLESLPKYFEWAIEFRHPSWLKPDIYRMLERKGIATTIVDEPLLPPDIHITTDFSYIRWHGHGVSPWYNYDYSPIELEQWVPRVREIQRKTRRTYAYFNNHFSANAVKNAVEMLELLGAATQQQKKILKKIVSYKKQRETPKNVQSLDAFTYIDKEDLGVADLLIRLTSTSRLRSAEKIEDKEADIIYNTPELVKAHIKDYEVEIDLKKKVLKHNCEDWRKVKYRKRLCKHVLKLFLIIEEHRAVRILDNIWENKDKWRFEDL